MDELLELARSGRSLTQNIEELTSVGTHLGWSSFFPGTVTIVPKLPGSKVILGIDLQTLLGQLGVGTIDTAFSR